jgi:hypothetical protein
MFLTQQITVVEMTLLILQSLVVLVSLSVSLVVLEMHLIQPRLEETVIAVE